VTAKTDRFPNRQLTYWLLTGLFASAVLGVYWVFAHTYRGQAVEEAALVGRSVRPHDIAGDALELLDVVGLVSLAAACALLGAIALARRRWWLAVATGTMVLGANVTTQLLKRELLVAVVVAGWHRPSDAVGAWLVVGSWTALVLAVLAAGGRVPVMRPIRKSILAVLLVFGVVTVVLGSFALLGLAAAESWFVEGAFNDARRGVAYVAASAGIIASATLMVGTLLVALRGATIGHRPPQTTAAEEPSPIMASPR
jgi:hypothetical protein